ncbi:hypothetical protein SDC9_116754 [bioreactor metagenome]|uniref:SLH domain-containing protein n=1 Tax=bioreactor metagenome TaxID=1076179 RepID=A0A645BWA6_9ZZZZ
MESKTSPTGGVTTSEKVVWFDASQYDGLDESCAYVFGGRSFSIYQVGGTGLTLVYDSGSDFEEVTAKYLPEVFNCSNDKITLDNRSGKKGTEPENVTVGTVSGKTYAFIALERIGGIIIYNITSPASASYVNYINSRDFSDAIAGDVSPEGISFAKINGIPTLLTANEVSGTVCAYTLTAKTTTSGSGGSTVTAAYTIAAEAGAGGSISPSGSASVAKSSSKTYTVTADTGYEIADVLVDGKNVGAVTSFTFEDVTANHTISASFKKTVEPAGTAWTNPFTDVKESDWYYSSVRYVSESGLMTGTGSGQFSPQAQVTRGMLMTILHRLDGSPAVSSTGAFADVASGMWYADAVSWAGEKGIAAGYGNGLFGGGDTVTLEQAVSFLYRYANYKGYDTGRTGSLEAFSDAGDTSDYAMEAMRWAVSTGLIKGSGGILNPQGISQRSQIAAILQRFSENIIK